jgi:hypothetical protein
MRFVNGNKKYAYMIKGVFMRVSLILFSIVFGTGAALANDGSYSGRRNLAPNMPSVCKDTSISGTVRGSQVELVLAYNGASIAGRLSPNGSFTARGSAGRYGYVFSGQVKGGRMSGSWYSQPRDCSGTWSARKSG